ncbi:hypothetical protein V1Y59_14165 [Gordonia sp. PKS22-38]|uniref:Uncharacterized protein n=1 Tax=Gordonia prachuapensis TaxID=3115651 RepID=A0ABU7MW85_9ACTN|nr:hypothetical protein [Gordonia sp. PKS22-38]
MQIRVVVGGPPRNEIVVTAGFGEFRCEWRGREEVPTGSVVDVEIEVTENANSMQVVGTDATPGITSVDNRVTIIGRIAEVEDEDLYVLDLEPGIIMVDRPSQPMDVAVGDLVSVMVEEVLAFPTNL